ncbi:MAG TPA: hypothetical protein VGI45_08390 [Terracidiphilus sp.]|jgi:hypothetical protein
MNWRRGLLLAGVNLAIVVPVLVWKEARFWPTTGTDTSSRLGAHFESVLFQEEMALDLDPCHWYDIGSPRLEEVGALANLPIALVTGWHEPCLTRTPLGRLVRRALGARNHIAEITDCGCLTLLVSIQWALVGGLPLVHPKRWWLEPGAFITSAAVVGAAFALIPMMYMLARIALVLVGLAWFWWCGLLIWKPVHLAWQSTLGGLRRLSN